MGNGGGSMTPLWLAIVGCSTSEPGAPPVPTPDPTVPEVPGAEVEGLSPLEMLARTSLDIRGVRPTPDEIARVEADPAALDALVEAFFVDPRFEDRVMALYQEVFLTKMEEIGFYDYAAF